MKNYLTAGQATAIFYALRGTVNGETAIEDAEFAEREKHNYKAASTFGDYIDVNRISIIERSEDEGACQASA